jgi:hypothetical protein
MFIDNSLLAQRPTVNPYRYAASEIWNRLKWDLTFESWRSRSKLQKLKNLYSGSKAVIICNGPSLLKSNLSLLDGIFTFGLNKINLLFDKSNFRPSCIVAVNHLVIEQNHQFYAQTDIPLFLDSYAVNLLQSRSNVTFLHSSRECNFARDCSLSIYNGYTITFVALQLAFHMGFQDVALIGCDHSFATKGATNKTVIAEEKDENHFDPNYFAGGVKWQLPDLFQSEVSYNLAHNIYQAAGKNLVNATEGGCLEIFPRMKLDEFVQKKVSVGVNSLV